MSDNAVKGRRLSGFAARWGHMMATGMAVVGLLTLISLARYERHSALRQRALLLQHLASSLRREGSSDALNPYVDLRSQVLHKHPDLAERAREILARGDRTPKSPDEFRVLFYYFFVLGDHESVAELVQHSEFMNTDLLDYAYLLPAYLYERLGLRDLAQMNYERYLVLLRDESIGSSYAFRWRPFQRRLTVARVKVAFLREALPAVRSSYYKVSYLSALLNDFFEETLQQSFIQKYVRAGVIERPPVDLAAVEFDAGPLTEWARSLKGVAEDPYAYYELCASALEAGSWLDADTCRLNELAAGDLNGHVLRPLAVFLKARLEDDPAVSRKLFELIGHGPPHKAEFLRDDARFFMAMSLYEQGRSKEASLELSSIVKDFGTGGYDAVRYAEDFLEWQRQKVK